MKWPIRDGFAALRWQFLGYLLPSILLSLLPRVGSQKSEVGFKIQLVDVEKRTFMYHCI